MKNAIATLALIVLGAGSAFAEPVVVEGTRYPTERVSYADLNLTDDQGISTLKRRVRGAAGRLCLSHSVEPLQVWLASKNCYRGAVADAYSQIDRVIAGQRSGTSLASAILVVTAR